MMPTREPRVAVLVCGALERGDDGAAFAAIDALPRDLLHRVDVVRCGQLEVDHLLDVPDGAGCVVVDTAVGVPPGEVVVVPLDAIAARTGRAAPRSSHTMPPDQAIALAATLRGRAPQGVFVGIGGAEFRLGSEMSPAVRTGLPRLVAALAAEIAHLAAEAPPGG